MNELLRDYAKQYSSIMSDDLSSNWLKGDIAVFVYGLDEQEKEEKGKSSILKEFLKTTNEIRGTFIQHRWIAKAFEEEAIRHLPDICWTHYRTCIKTDNPKEWLIKAHDNKWTVAKLISEIKHAKAEIEVDNGLTCIKCNNKIDKINMVEISYNKNRAILCSVNCAIKYLQEVKDGIQ